MKTFTEIVESQKDANIVDKEEFTRYFKAASKMKLPRDVQAILRYMNEYDIMSKQVIEQIIKGGATIMRRISSEYGIPSNILTEMQKILKNLRENIRLIPVFMTSDEMSELESGKKTIQDITLDLESDRGRAMCARQYANLVIAIARKYMGKSGLDWNSLISAGQLGLTAAMNDYHKPDERIDVDNTISQDQKGEAKQAKGLTFKQYAGWRIRNQILNDINTLSRTVRITQHEYEKNKASGNTKGNFNTKYIDTTYDDEGRSMLDRMPELANDMGPMDRDTEKMFSKLYAAIDNKFNTRDASIFFQYMGLRGYKQKTGLELAKENGLTSARISYIISGILKYLRSEPKLSEYLDALRDMYSESLLAANYDKSRNDIMEALVSDDVYIMLIDLTKWSDKLVFNNTIGEALQYFGAGEREQIMECLHNIDYIDESYNRDSRKVYVEFLEHVYPTTNIRRATDTDILNRMVELNEYFNKHNL